MLQDWLVVGMVALGLAIFVLFWGGFLVGTWTAEPNEPPNLDPGFVNIANLIGGVLGTAFAILLGIDEGEDPKEDVRGPTDAASVATTSKLPEYLFTAGIVIFFLAGVAAVIVWWRRRDRTPEAVKNFSTVFVGYAVSVMGLAFRIPDRISV